MLSRFGMEAAAIAQLKHPNIVEVYDYHRDHETFYLVMEFIDGPTLRAYVEKKRGLDVVEGTVSVPFHRQGPVLRAQEQPHSS